MSYNNAMVGYLWAQREKQSARSSNGNTTSGKHEHEENLAHLVGSYNDEVHRATRARVDYRNPTEAALTERLEGLADEARRYAKLFKVKAPRFDPAKDAAKVFDKRAAREAKANTPAAIAKRAKAAAAREALQARKAELERLEGLERVEAWKRGEPVQLRYGQGQDENGGALLRVCGDKLETSLGASVPLDHAIRVYRFVKLCRERNEGWQRNGRALRVGHFQVDTVRPDGSFTAGCHTISWPAIEAAAQQAGVTDLPPEDTREGEAA